jgi:diguanylate cyclase (GGDEF)-like protein/PAS domain S-box-containing protein
MRNVNPNKLKETIINMKVQTSKTVETKNKLPGRRVSKIPFISPHNSNGHKQKTDVDECDDQADDALKESEIRYRRLFESAKDGILILNAVTGAINDVNPFLTNLLGFSHEEMLGKKLWEIGLFKDDEANRAAFKELQEKKYIRYEELPLETKQGAHVEVEFVSNVYQSNGKKVIQCNIRDITGRKQAKVHLEKINEELSALVAELQTRDREMKLINQMNDLLQACKTLEEAFKVIGMACEELFSGQSGGMAVLHDSGKFLETFTRWGKKPLLEDVFALEDCWAMRRGQQHEVTDPQINMICHHFTKTPTSGYLCLPMVVQGEMLGLFHLETPEEMSLDQAVNWKQKAVTVNEGVKISLSNLKLRELMHRQANHDPLTGLFNRRYLDDTLPRELNHARRKNDPTSVAMLDIDHFKKFNDSYGHEAGDLILRELGHLFRENLRKSDIACRYGGEEFVIVLFDSKQEESLKRFEAIREQINNLQIRYREQLLGRMTVSVGIVEATDNTLTAAELVSAADKALYAAKRAGRDCIIAYSELEPEIK